MRSGRVIQVPSLSRAEYGGPRDPELASKWEGFRPGHGARRGVQGAGEGRQRRRRAGAAVAQGDGFEFVMRRWAPAWAPVFSDGRLLPHMELSHAPFRDGETFDILLGNEHRKKIGKKHWRARHRGDPGLRRLPLLRPHLHRRRQRQQHYPVTLLRAKATIVPNTSGILGGIKIWDMDLRVVA